MNEEKKSTLGHRVTKIYSLVQKSSTGDTCPRRIRVEAPLTPKHQIAIGMDN